MKKIVFCLMSFALLMYSCDSKPEGGGENTADSTMVENSGVQNFGAVITEEGAISAAELVAAMEGKDSIQIKVTGKIDEVCQKKGCWMDVAMGEDEFLFVKFKDYEFFVPKDAAGKEVVIDGYAFIDTTSVEELRHYAEDAGEPDSVINAITEPEIGYNFMANGVIIKN